MLAGITAALRTVERVRRLNAGGELRRDDAASVAALLGEAWAALGAATCALRDAGDGDEALSYHMDDAADALATALAMDVAARTDAEYAIDVDVYTGGAAAALRCALLIGTEPAGTV